MSGAYGGYCYSDKRVAKCRCGAELCTADYLQSGMCPDCLEWHRRNPGNKIKKCRVCSKPFLRHAFDNGMCSDACRTQHALREYHSDLAKRWFRDGWGWLVLDIMQQVHQELYPSPLIAEETFQPMATWNILCDTDYKVPARRTSKLSSRPPQIDNVVTGVAVSSNMAMDYEDQVEMAWDRMDEEKHR